MTDLVPIILILCIFICVMYLIYTRYRISKDGITMGYTQVIETDENGVTYIL